MKRTPDPIRQAVQGTTETRVKVKLYVYGIEAGTAAAAPTTQENAFIASLSVAVAQCFAAFSPRSKAGLSEIEEY